MPPFRESAFFLAASGDDGSVAPCTKRYAKTLMSISSPGQSVLAMNAPTYKPQYPCTVPHCYACKKWDAAIMHGFVRSAHKNVLRITIFRSPVKKNTTN